MSRLIAGQIQDGDSSTYDIKECWIISIGRKEFFKSSIHGTPIDLPYEIWSRPTIEIPGQNGASSTFITTPQNVMNWKFFSLEKFNKLCQNGDIKVTKDSCLKEQFMEFLIKCSSMQHKPEDRHETIKEAYEVMKIANFTPNDFFKVQEEKTEEFFNRLEARAQEEARKQQLAEELARGKAEGIAKGIAEGIKVALKYNPAANLVEDFHISQSAMDKIISLPEPRETTNIANILLSVGDSTYDQPLVGKGSLDSTFH